MIITDLLDNYRYLLENNVILMDTSFTVILILINT